MLFTKRRKLFLFTWSSAKTFVVAKNCILVVLNEFLLKHSSKKTCTLEFISEDKHLSQESKKFIIKLSKNLAIFSRKNRIVHYVQYLQFVKYIEQNTKIGHEVFEKKKGTISRFLIFSFQWVLSKFAIFELLTSLKQTMQNVNATEQNSFSLKSQNIRRSPYSMIKQWRCWTTIIFDFLSFICCKGKGVYRRECKSSFYSYITSAIFLNY